jgi:hypothetical protein
MSTAIPRHLPRLNTKTLSAERVMWPARIASHMSIGSGVAGRGAGGQWPCGRTGGEAGVM